MRDPTDLAGQKTDDKERADKAALDALQRVEDVRWLMASKAGRRIAWGWLSDAGVFRNPFNHSGSITAFNCGQMNIGQRFFAEIMQHAPDTYVVMLKENGSNDDQR